MIAKRHYCGSTPTWSSRSRIPEGVSKALPRWGVWLEIFLLHGIAYDPGARSSDCPRHMS